MPDQLSTDDLRRLRDFRARIGYADPPIGYREPDWKPDPPGFYMPEPLIPPWVGWTILGIMGGGAVAIGFWLLLQIYSWAWGAS